MDVDIGNLYATLRQWVAAGKANPQSYTQLSHDYHRRTGIWVEPHPGWDSALGELNETLYSIGAPALSALVILQKTNEPGNGFWGSAPNAPARPKNDLERIAVWNRIITEIERYGWPESLLP